MFRLCIGLTALSLVSLASAQAPDRPPGGTPGGPLPGGPPGGFRPFTFPQPGQILSAAIQDQLKLTAEQKKQLAEYQKEVDDRLKKLLTADQQKSFQAIRSGKGGFGPGKGFGPPPGGGFGPGAGGTRNDDVKKQLGATDEEWKVIGPKFQKLLAARRVLNADTRPVEGGFGAGMGASIITQAQAELKTVLADPKHTKAEVDEKIEAIRKAKQTARASHDAAQKDLLPLLTPQQEAVLLSLGHLD